MTVENPLLVALLQAKQEENDTGDGWYSIQECADMMGATVSIARPRIKALLRDGTMEASKQRRLNEWGDHYMCPVVRLVAVEGGASNN